MPDVKTDIKCTLNKFLDDYFVQYFGKVVSWILDLKLILSVGFIGFI